jgi:predicted sugar kinase
MFIDLTSPASLPLGLVRTATGVGLLGLTLKYPQTQLTAQKRGASLVVTGPRAPVAHDYASRFIARHRLDAQLEIAVEWAIANYMGLSSEPMLALSAARALAWLNDLPTDGTPALAQAIGLGPEHALALWGFHQGGALLVGLENEGDMPPPILRRARIEHDEDHVWALVFHFPHVPDEISATYETDQMLALRRAAPYLSAETGQVFENQLWPAIERNDIATFAQAVMRVDELNREALAQAGTPNLIGSEAQDVLNVMRDNGAVAWGQCLTGLGLFGLVHGTETSQKLRHVLRGHVGHFGGTQIAAIVDNAGATWMSCGATPSGR